jgi:hypothetical protein
VDWNATCSQSSGEILVVYLQLGRGTQPERFVLWDVIARFSVHVDRGHSVYYFYDSYIKTHNNASQNLNMFGV